ncbi:MAG: hypothetical protein IID33_12215, partial [Planctomycetes bacterium]|nr:hypothetical protein [Planctomycetota bacterium]
MKRKINKLRNPDFSAGNKHPLGWAFASTAAGAGWSRPEADGGIRIESSGSGSTALFQQVAVCKPLQDYRVEIDATCDLTASAKRAEGEPNGLVIQVEPVTRDAKPRPAGERRVTPGIHRSAEPVTIRAFYEAPDGVRRLRISVGILNAHGAVHIHRVRLIPVLETDEVSHPLAVPPPTHAVPIPRVVRNVCVCSATASDRPLTAWLAAYFGKAKTTAVQPGDLRAASLRADALFLPDAKPPPAVRSLAALAKLAEQRIVVVSLPAFHTLTRGALSLRRVEQADDPIHAKVDFANYATHGFALHDIFPYAWGGQSHGSFVQNQFRKTGSLEAFLRRHGFDVLLQSMCDQDVTTDRPIALHKPTNRGGLFVLDIEPIEVEGSTYGEPALAAHLLLNILGHCQAGLGRYCSPLPNETRIRELIREMPLRLEHFVVHDANIPTEEVAEQVVTLGRGDESYGLALTPKPMIVVRSGLESGDAESFYGAMMWFKQFARTVPHECPYATPLSSGFRFAWIPHCAKWEPRTGWAARREPLPHGRGSDQQAGLAGRQAGLADPLRTASAVARVLEGASIAALIDIVSCPVNRVRVVVPTGSGAYRNYGDLLPQLAESFPLGRYFLPTVGEDEGFADRDALDWRHVNYIPRVVVDPDAFADAAHRDVIRAGGQVIRIEVPGHDADFTCQSILRTDLVATLLEHVIGLQYGLIAVN